MLIKASTAASLYGVSRYMTATRCRCAHHERIVGDEEVDQVELLLVIHHETQDLSLVDRLRPRYLKTELQKESSNNSIYCEPVKYCHLRCAAFQNAETCRRLENQGASASPLRVLITKTFTLMSASANPDLLRTSPLHTLE